MNTLVEKMFGIIMFLAIFVPFQLGLYASYMDAWEFTQVTTEFTQLVKEEGKYTTTGRAGRYYGDIDDKGTGNTVEKPYDLFSSGYRIVITNKRTNLTSVVTNTEKEDKNVDAQVGDVLEIKYFKNKETVYGWKPDLKKVTNVTVYKR